ncbi:MAG TPA: M48 family peptidase, partial [Candidatus Eisenbacteria bacterium]|nr:M48 family peptidase [Candidatus Eisenbacteria bacterium]
MRRGRLLLGLLIAAISLISYYSLQQQNPVTGETQHIAMDVDQEVALGLESAPQMAEEMGGLDPDESIQQRVQQVGQRVVQQSEARGTPYQY